MLKQSLVLVAAITLAACGGSERGVNKIFTDTLKAKTEKYAPVDLTADLSKLTENERKMLPLLIEVAKIMDELFWAQANPEAKRDSFATPQEKELYTINYGPWDRLEGNNPFILGVKAKPEGANFYPLDMTKQEFEKWQSPNKSNQYTMVRRDDAKFLKTVPYSEYFKTQLEKAATLLKQAAELAEDEGLKNYLTLRAEALLTDNFNPSDIAWLQMKNNTIDFICGPIETYEDKLFGIRTSYEAYLCIKDKEWSQRLVKYAALLPKLQAELPVDPKYKAETPGSNSDLGAYDAIYYAGHCNSGSKTIAVNLPNDGALQLQYGTRRLQFKNVIRAKFDKILKPIAEELIDPSQVANVTFDAFFNDVMFHEVAHGLGIKYVITSNGKTQVKDALGALGDALEEGKADILGLYMITKLADMGEFTPQELNNCYVSFMAGIFRSVRFGSASDHGRANLIRFNYFKERGAFSRTAQGKYKVDFVKMKDAMNSLSTLILTLQGNGDKAAVEKLFNEKGVMDNQLKADLDRLKAKNIPVDIIFNQGAKVLGL